MSYKKYIAMAGLIIAVATVSEARPATMSVQVQKGQLRATPAFLGRIEANLQYGDLVTVLETEKGWVHVETSGGAKGWIHESALTRKKIELKSGQADVETKASSEELALAGKGFNSDVEAEFKTKNADMDFTWIDRMLEFSVSAEEMVAFLREGGVEPAKGGAE
ncbi:MAG: SH3 domain-containing protein [Verrucomicrobia bacterium]|nr:SH3 domain-containing protein [Verrucomicrobiota bacterium]